MPAQAQAVQGRYDIVIIGGGSAGIAIAQGLLKRDKMLDIAVIEPSRQHYYQPGWTLVGGGVFTADETVRSTTEVMPEGVTWLQASATAIDPDICQVTLNDASTVSYRVLIAAPGLELHWEGIEGLKASLGSNGVTSNYDFNLAPYTWELVKGLRRGKALFTQPPMPIKCAGAPQKAMYLACDNWRREGVLESIDVSFHNAGGVLFGVDAYVPALMEYVDRYDIDLRFKQRLVAVDGPSRQATFMVADEDGQETEYTTSFDMLHAVPPQRAPALIRESVLANAAGWLDLDQHTLQHTRYPNVFGAGDVSGTSNAKTAAAARAQVPIVADNIAAFLAGHPLPGRYQGYGACPLTVERGRVVLAEFGYDGVLQPTFPGWLNDGRTATQKAWWLKAQALPYIYWNCMLKGREWLVR